MKDNTFLIIIITITIIILFICECNKDLIEGMVVFKWYDVNNVALGPKYNQCIDSISQRIKSSSSNEIATLSTLLTDGMNGCADTYLNQDIPTVKNALVARFQAEAAERVHEEKLKDESIYEPELLPDGSPNEKYGELKDDIKEQLRIQDQRKAELTTLLSSKNVVTIAPTFVDATFLYVVPTITTRYNVGQTSKTASAISDLIAQAVRDFVNQHNFKINFICVIFTN